MCVSMGYGGTECKCKCKIGRTVWMKCYECRHRLVSNIHFTLNIFFSFQLMSSLLYIISLMKKARKARKAKKKTKQRRKTKAKKYIEKVVRKMDSWKQNWNWKDKDKKGRAKNYWRNGKRRKKNANGIERQRLWMNGKDRKRCILHCAQNTFY